VKTSVKGLRMSRDSRGVVFDLPSDLSDVVEVVHTCTYSKNLSLFPFLSPSLPSPSPSLSLYLFTFSLTLSSPPPPSLALPPYLSVMNH
jgi:hypothetical protein